MYGRGCETVTKNDSKHTQTITKAYKIELKPNKTQEKLLKQSCGAARFAYNWGLAHIKRIWTLNKLPISRIKHPSAIDLHKELCKLKKERFPWMYEVSKWAPQEALRDLDRAFKNFFEGRSGFPKFKKKGVRESSRLYRVEPHHITNTHIRLPRIDKIRLKEKGYIPTSGVEVRHATISEIAGRWFVSVNVKEEIEIPDNRGPVVGVDVGISSLATISDGTIIKNPRSLEKRLRKLKRLQRAYPERRKEAGMGRRQGYLWQSNTSRSPASERMP